MIAAKLLIDEGERGLRGLQEERVVITADESVEGCELSGRKGLDVPGRDVSILRSRSRLVFIFTHGHTLGCGSKH